MSLFSFDRVTDIKSNPPLSYSRNFRKSQRDIGWHEFLHLKTQREIIHRIHFRMKILKIVANIVEVAWTKSEFPELHFSVSQKQASTSKPLAFSCMWQPEKKRKTSCEIWNKSYRKMLPRKAVNLAYKSHFLLVLFDRNSFCMTLKHINFGPINFSKIFVPPQNLSWAPLILIEALIWHCL